MARMRYDKLVRDRDRIPEIIGADGRQFEVEHLDDDEWFRRALRDKLLEEATEAASATDADLATELADLQEVIGALIDAVGLTSEGVRQLQELRRRERGGLMRRLRLLRTE